MAFLADHPALKEFLGSLLWLAAAYVAARIASFLIGLLIQRSNERGVDPRLLSALKRPITYALFLFGAWAAVNRMPVSARVDAVVDGAIFAFGVLLVTLAIARAYSILLDWYAARAHPDAASRDLAREFNPLFSKVGKVFIALVALSMLLQHFGVNVASLVVSLGVGSLAAPSLQVTDFRVAAQILVKLSRGTELAITVRPVNLGFRITHESTQEQESRIEICVNRVPLPGGSPMKSEEQTKGESK